MHRENGWTQLFEFALLNLLGSHTVKSEKAIVLSRIVNRYLQLSC